MTLHAPYAPITYNGNGTTTRFPITFLFANPETVRVVETDEDGAETVQVFGADFTIEGGDSADGTVVAATAPAATVTWTISRRTPLLMGYTALEAPPPPVASAFIAVGERGQIAKTTDDGTTWTGVGPGNVNQPGGAGPAGYVADFYAVDSDGAGTWMATSEYTGIWRSIDDGDTWAPIAGTYTASNVTSPRWTYIKYCGAGVWLANQLSGGAYIYRSTDDGDTWDEITHGITWAGGGTELPFQIAADQTNGIVLFGCYPPDANIGRSTDRGLTWETVNGDPDNYAQPIMFSFANGMFFLADNGMFYTTPDGSLGSFTLYIMDPDNGRGGHFVYDGSVYRGVDMSGHGALKRATIGTTWEYTYPNTYSEYPNDVATNGAGVTIYVGEPNGLSATCTGFYRANSDTTLTASPHPDGYLWPMWAVAFGGS